MSTLPIAIYNTYKKQVVGIFKTNALAARYLFPCKTNHTNSLICNALIRKGRILKSIFDFPAAIRYANALQIELLDGKDYLIMDGYPIPHYTKMKGFDSTKESLQCGSIERLNRFNAEQKNKRQSEQKADFNNNGCHICGGSKGHTIECTLWCGNTVIV